jgi:2-oxoglutarate dehydrogenase E2 component (dihydrolipoamide succinyltransferase)
MKSEIKVPAVGESISEATIGLVIKPTGSHVRIDDELLELETDKVNQVLYAPQEGEVTLHVKQGDTVKIGQVIGFIDTAAKEASVDAPATPSAPIPPIVSEKSKPVEEKKEPVASPQVKKSEVRRKMSRIRKVIAQRLMEAQHTTAMLTTFNEVDMSQVMVLRETYKEAFTKKYGVKLGFMSFFVKASVEALQQFPDVNSYIDGDDIVHREYYDIAIAVGTDKGVFVPVVRDCDKLSFAEIESAIEQFAKKAKEGMLAVEDLQGGGFTITNGGVYGSLLSTPILNPPQSGILGMHKIAKRAVVVNDEIVIRPMMYVALSYDHRIIDGKEAVSFLVTLKQMLEDPSRLLLDV